MSVLRPGEFDITDKGIQLAELKAGQKILDIGCGEGDTVNHLIKEYRMEAEGIDMNLARISDAKEKYPGIEVNFGDGEFLDNYLSYTFDGVFMECVLSLINIPDESLHEVYCVLKKGGKLVISDLYEKDPDPTQVKAVKIEADRQAKIPHQEGDCEENPTRFVDFRFEGAFYKEPLIEQLKEIGFEIAAFEDRSKDLDDYVADIMMNGGCLDGLMTNVKTQAGSKKRKIGYFLLVAKKPE
ncbi:MAG: class I SAM-dependent methyltransferase [Clostridiales bacterium]|nr:class I SAM-dependent methyltransferase [Clostridiales bacterium]